MKGKMRPPLKKGVLKRVLGLLFKSYPVLLPISITCIAVSAIVSAIPAVFLQQVTSLIDSSLKANLSWDVIGGEIVTKISLLIVFYVLSLITITVDSQLMAYITQGFLSKMRRKMFDGMQKLPIKYFDTNKHGDIMSYYTNDIDTFRQLVSQSIPTLIRSSIIVITVLSVMLSYSLWLTLILLFGVFLMFMVTKKVGGGSAKYFGKLQKSVAVEEGYIQEMMNGQKVVKVFCHEDKVNDEFNRINDALFENSFRAHANANMLGPILMNIGNVFYVIIAVIGGLFCLMGDSFVNVSLSGMAFEVSIVVAFLSMTKQFTGNVNQVSQQVNSIVMGLAGASRIFDLIDQKPETDDGYVTLVNAEIDEQGNITEVERHTGKWAWRHPHSADGSVTYTELKGDVRLTEVDFAYEEGKPVLHDVSVFAEPGQKVAFVGATGAGKTTITNLINRFYDIADGKIRYDGININKIKKSDLRRSLGIVLQETNLFTGTVMDNIRYGKLDATDEECINAAKLSGAHDFISRLPSGYETELTNNGANLSQGQRQLIAIARAAVADPPVMILDEATSSIDTRTEAIVQRGMDKLMEGRTVFVIAHRLSTVMNSDVIMVLDHGRIIERGNHEKLIAEKGTYYQLYTGAFELE
ncbi:MAG: ABC transporter ATP-binding protein [Clostridia bacterium]|nr:ABC transporter ATP-binding protein [Clostridia bacterium]